MKTISIRVWKRNSTAWHFERIVKTADNQKLKVVIVRDAYDCQSLATVSRWDGEKWQYVNGKSIEECACRNISYVDENVSDKNFNADYQDLLKIAIEIVS